MKAQRGKELYCLFNLSARWQWVVNAMSQPPYLQEMTWYTFYSSGVPRNFFRGGVQQIQRTERTGIWGRWPLSQWFWRQL